MSNVRIAEVGRLKSLLLDHPDPVLLLGAGASRSSGVPLAGETVEKIARWAWCKNNGRHVEDFSVTRSDYWPWLSRQSWFSADKSNADQYPLVVDNLLSVKKDRREFFEHLINPNVPPSKGYRALARILGQGWISTVLTTNFDNCLPRAATLENNPHTLVTIKTPDDLIRFNSSPAYPQLIYLHGSVEHYSDKNIVEEIANLDTRVTELIWPLLRDHPIIVVGYRGTEPSVMNDLFLQQIANTSAFAQGIYWCVLEPEINNPLSDKAQALADKAGSNFQKVAIKGFDELFQFDLWDPLVASNARPRPRLQSYSAIEPPRDMQPLKGVTFSDLDQNLLFARLKQYAARLNLWSPEYYDEKWTTDLAVSQNLAILSGNDLMPTLAGELLFGRNVPAHCSNAAIDFEAIGPLSWLKRCFGDETIADDVGRDEYRVERRLDGNLWSQLDTLTDLISLVNVEFRLKEEISRQVQAYNTLALKEMVVNAIVHRDYGSTNVVKVQVTPAFIAVESPGGLIDEVSAQTAGMTLQAAIIGGRRQIKGYRNPAISDLFYGGGQMDRAGSGLPDMWQETVNNNGRVEFGPNEDNDSFYVKIFSRPEAVDQVTHTAVPLNDTVRFVTNLVEIVQLPRQVWHVGTSARTFDQMRKDASDMALPKGYVQDGRMFTLFDLEAIAEDLVPGFDSSDVEALSFNEVLGLPNGHNILTKLISDAFSEHLRAIGLYVDVIRRRAYFPNETSEERKVTYKGRLRKATRTVVKTRMKRDSDQLLYHEHKAINFSLMPIGQQWTIVLTPGYAFTRDGRDNSITRERTNVLSTKRAARDFNPSVHHDLSFWMAMLSGEKDQPFELEFEDANDLADYGPQIILSDRLPTISYNAMAFATGDPDDDELTAAIREAEAELEALAEEDEEMDDSDDLPEGDNES